MMRSVALLMLLALTACETKEHADAELGALQKAKTAAAKASARANTGEAQEIGVAECDAYIKTYESCLAEKVPQERRDELRATLDQERNQWRDAVTSGQDQAAIGEQCKAAAARQPLREFGCTF